MHGETMKLQHIISCVSTVLSCAILLYLTQRECHNLRTCIQVTIPSISHGLFL